jgi:cell wall-associated NlpC family hydrolase
LQKQYKSPNIKCSILKGEEMTKQNSFIKNLNNEQKRERLIFFAKKQIGKPYKYGVKKRQIGKFFDCSSFTQYLYKRIGIEIPRSTILQASLKNEGMKVVPRKTGLIFKPEDLKIGDLLFFKRTKGHFNEEYPNGIGHVFMYFENKKFIHATGMGKKTGVKLENFEKVVSEKDFRIAKRILKD